MYGAAIPPILAVIENVPIAVFLKKRNHICVKVAVIGDPYGMSIDDWYVSQLLGFVQHPDIIWTEGWN